MKVGRAVRVPKDAVDNLPEPVEPDLEPGKKKRRPKAFTMDDPLWQLIGAGDDLATDVSENKYKYLLEAFEAKQAAYEATRQ